MIFRRRLLIILAALSLLKPVKTRGMEYIASCLNLKSLFCCVATAFTCKQIRTPDKSNPTLEELNIKTYVPAKKDTGSTKVLTDSEQVKKHLISQESADVDIQMSKNKIFTLTSGFPEALKSAPEICIALGGSLNNWELFTGFKNYNPGGYSGYRFIKSGIIDMPCVTFDCVTDKRKSFNFCQEQDLNSLDLTVKAIRKLNKDAKIVLAGICKGGSLALRYIAEKTEKKETAELSAIKAIVVEGPPNSVKDSIKNQFGYPLSLGAAKLCLPNFDSNAKTILQAKKFSNIPLLVGTIPKDSICTLNGVKEMTNHIASLDNNNVYLFESKEKISHSSMTKLDVSWQKTAQAFLGKHLSRSEQKEIKENTELDTLKVTIKKMA